MILAKRPRSDNPVTAPCPGASLWALSNFAWVLPARVVKLLMCPGDNTCLRSLGIISCQLNLKQASHAHEPGWTVSQLTWLLFSLNGTSVVSYCSSPISYRDVALREQPAPVFHVAEETAAPLQSIRNPHFSRICSLAVFVFPIIARSLAQ